MVITSKDNEFVKHVKKLKEKKYREEYGEFLVEGIKMIQEAITENAIIKQIVICDDCKTENVIPSDLMYEIAKYDCVYVNEKVFNAMTDVTNPQGILAIIEKYPSRENQIDYKEDFFLVLDNIQDPRKYGDNIKDSR